MTNPQSEDRAALLRQRYNLKPAPTAQKPPTTPSVSVGPEPSYDPVPREWDDRPAVEPRRAAPVNVNDDDAPSTSRHSHSTSPSSVSRAAYEEPDYSTADTRESDYIVDARYEKPQQGFRRFLANTLHLPVKKGKAEVEWDSWISNISHSVLESKVIGVIGGKGGVGKTTSAMVIASILAKYRAKPVCLITLDHNQTLALRTKTVTDSARGAMSLADFVSDPDIIRVSPERSSRVARYMKTNPQRLNVLGTGIDALHRQVLTAQDFNTALDILKGCYEIIVIDFGPPNTESYWAALESLNALVMVTSAENDSMRGVAQVENYVRESGLTTLIDHGTIDLVCRRNGVTTKVDLGKYVLNAHKKHRDVLEIPYDEHLSESGPIALDLMNKNTVYQYTIAAKLVMDRV